MTEWFVTLGLDLMSTKRSQFRTIDWNLRKRAALSSSFRRPQKHLKSAQLTVKKFLLWLVINCNMLQVQQYLSVHRNFAAVLQRHWKIIGNFDFKCFWSCYAVCCKWKIRLWNCVAKHNPREKATLFFITRYWCQVIINRLRINVYWHKCIFLRHISSLWVSF